jgi:acyl carrier protein
LDVNKEVVALLNEVLGLNGRSAQMDRNTPLLGAVPELDSIAVLAVITTIEERFGFTINDDELNGASFATVGTLTDFVITKLATSS